jgi:hypothetical protein
MSIHSYFRNPRIYFSPEHGGDAVKGGRPQSDPEGDGAEAIADALGQPVPGRGKTAGTADPGVPGSRTNPVELDRNPEPETNQPASTPGREGSAAGS